ncbi:MAG: preprotein translocase subunit SecE [Firmicutes bacterium]|nr:preprotein translocase subunit SecE [Bacillota bacterium]
MSNNNEHLMDATERKQAKADAKQARRDAKHGPQKAKRERKKLNIGKKIKETGSELKKVTWPAFPTVVKKTGVVIAVVLFFLVVLFGIDYLLQFLHKLLLTGSL